MALDLTAKQSASPAQKQMAFAKFVETKLSETLKGEKLQDFVAAVVSLRNNNPAVARCEPTSLLASCLQAHSLGLNFSQGLGQAWIVPYKNNKTGTTNATFQIG